MNNRTLNVLIAATFIGGACFAAKERVVRFQNHVRVGYDDNIYNTEDATGSGFITEIVNLTAKASFSSRTDALFYWEPNFNYRFDANPEMVVYQDLYGRLNHAISQRAFLTVSDRFRYQQKEGQVETVTGPSDFDQNYMENDLQGSVDYTLNTISYLKVGAGYEFRTWDDSDYGSGAANNDYTQFRGNGSYVRQLKPNKTEGLLGLNYTDHEYDGSRGGYNSLAFFGGLDQNFTPNVTGFGRLGFSMNSVDSGPSSSDTTTPYIQGGLEVNPSARTSLTGSLGYSVYRAENSFYNAQNRLNIGLGARHDITAKINLAASFSYIYGIYDTDYALPGVSSDLKDTYVTLGLRASYQVNRNNFLEAGYLFKTRTTSGGLSEFDGNRVDVAWRLRL